MKILIPNATGPTNTGDQAILVSLINILKDIYPGSELVIHSFTPDQFVSGLADRVEHNLYSWAVFQNNNPLIRSSRLLRVLANYLLPSPYWFKGNNYLAGLVADYNSSDLIIFCGGAYLRTKRGFTQTLNLMMHLLMVAYAKKSKKRIIFAPMSFGPFYSRWQERIAAKTLDGVESIIIREDRSLDILNNYSLKSPIHKSHDLALLLDQSRYLPVLDTKNKEKVLGFTVREWFKPEKQYLFERRLAGALSFFAKERGLSVRPIVQVNVPEYNEGDNESTSRVLNFISENGVIVLDKKYVTSLNEAFKIYSEPEFIVGMRMHSNILSVLCGVPFVAIGYEHKTAGIASDLGMDKVCIEAEEIFSKNKLGEFFIDAFDKRDELRNTASKRLDILKKEGVAELSKLLA